VTIEKTELRFPSRIESVDEAASAVAEIVKRTGMGEEAAFEIDLAVREAITNAMLHGNKFDETKMVDISVSYTSSVLEITVHDQGPGFNPAGVPDPTKEENLLKSSGRGIFFMRTFMDEVNWSIRPQGGTTVRMIKRI
jgi:serine/threonine-protein kinase RsbW